MTEVVIDGRPYTVVTEAYSTYGGTFPSQPTIEDIGDPAEDYDYCVGCDHEGELFHRDDLTEYCGHDGGYRCWECGHCGHFDCQ